MTPLLSLADVELAQLIATAALPPFGQFVPVHIHPTQDEFILVQEGSLDLKLDGVWVKAEAGDLVPGIVLDFADAEAGGAVRQTAQSAGSRGGGAHFGRTRGEFPAAGRQRLGVLLGIEPCTVTASCGAREQRIAIVWPPCTTTSQNSPALMMTSWNYELPPLSRSSTAAGANQNKMQPCKANSASPSAKC
jgi:hypothetical protein